MISLRKALAVLALLAVVALALVWFLPARWALPWIEPQLHGLHLARVHGSVWNGDAGDVLDVDGRRLGAARWQLSRRALLGEPHAQLWFEGAQLVFSGSVRRAAEGRVEAEKWRVRADLASLAIPSTVPWGRPLGELELHIDRAVLQGGWPLQLQARWHWHRAATRTARGDVPLGEIRGQAQAQGGLIRITWQDDGEGPLQTHGDLQLSPLGWRADGTLRARKPDPALRRWLARLGPAAPDGGVHIRQRGGLAANPSPNPPGGALP